MIAIQTFGLYYRSCKHCFQVMHSSMIQSFFSFMNYDIICVLMIIIFQPFVLLPVVQIKLMTHSLNGKTVLCSMLSLRFVHSELHFHSWQSSPPNQGFKVWYSTVVADSYSVFIISVSSSASCLCGLFVFIFIITCLSLHFECEIYFFFYFQYLFT